MAALVAVMIMVSVGTFDWHSIQPATLRRMPKSETVVMVATVVVVVATHNLAIGVVVGVLVAMVIFARRVAHFTEVVDVAHPDEDTRVYAVTASCSSPPATTSSTSSTTRRPRRTSSSTCPAPTSGTPRPSPPWTPSPPSTPPGQDVTIIGLNDASQERHDRLAGHLSGAH